MTETLERVKCDNEACRFADFAHYVDEHHTLLAKLNIILRQLRMPGN